MESGTIRFNKVALGQIIKSHNIMLFAANVEYFKGIKSPYSQRENIKAETLKLSYLISCYIRLNFL